MHTTAATLARRWFEEVWNDRRDEAVDQLMHEECIDHMEGGDVIGPAGFRQARDAFLAALPDLHITVEDVLSDGDHVVVRWRANGIHSGSGFGEKATDRAVEVGGMSWAVIRDGKVVEGWDSWNFHGLMTAIGAV
jgi:steroid delta-isomerase-like uncharacterized protein